MTSDDKYTILVRHIRRRINDMVDESATEEAPPVYTLAELKDEIDLAIIHIAGDSADLDITTVRIKHYELIILRVWAMLAKMLAFDSAKFFYMQQTSQTYDKGQRTAHYLNVAENLEKLFTEAMEQQGILGTICVGDIQVLNRADLKEETAVSDIPPKSVMFTETPEDLSGVTGFTAGDHKLKWERSNEWDFYAYKVYKGYSSDVNKDTGSILETIVYNNTPELVVNVSAEIRDVYYIVYVVDNRDQYSKLSDSAIIERTGSV